MMSSRHALLNLQVAARPTLASTPHAGSCPGHARQVRTTVNTKGNTTRALVALQEVIGNSSPASADGSPGLRTPLRSSAG